MWPRSIPNKFVTVTIQPHQITCSYLDRWYKHKPYIVYAYQRTLLSNFACEKLLLFNPSFLQKNVLDFLRKNNINNCYLILVLSGPGIFDRFIPTAITNPTIGDFPLPHAPHMQWQYQYLYTNERNQLIYHVIGIPQVLLLQYQLWALRAQINITVITIQRTALLHLYRFIHGTAFRQAQLGLDLMQHHHIVEALFHQEALARIAHIPSHITINSKDTLPLLTACGLLTQELI